MAQLFGHEKLKVYQKAMDFASIRSELLGSLSRRSLPMTLNPTLDSHSSSVTLNRRVYSTLRLAYRSLSTHKHTDHSDSLSIRKVHR